jgi:hypothetical protein
MISACVEPFLVLFAASFYGAREGPPSRLPRLLYSKLFLSCS